jgi:phosphohistidine phosphatase SixA
MPMLRLLALPLLALACAGAAPASPPAPDVYVMRHLEKEAGQDPGLSEAGQRGAGRLVAFFAGRPPAAIYVSTTRRARETAAPLAARLGLIPKDYAPTDVDGLVARVKAEKGIVLIVGHSNTVPEIVEKLGGARPADIAEDRFGDIWHVWGAPPRTERSALGD